MTREPTVEVRGAVVFGAAGELRPLARRGRLGDLLQAATKAEHTHSDATTSDKAALVSIRGRETESGRAIPLASTGTQTAQDRAVLTKAVQSERAYLSRPQH